MPLPDAGDAAESRRREYQVQVTVAYQPFGVGRGRYEFVQPAPGSDAVT